MNKRAKRRIKLYGSYAAIVSFVLMGLMLFGISPFKLAVFGILIVLGCISRLYKHFVGISIGFELVTPLTILFTYSEGILFGILVSSFMFIVSTMLSGSLNANAFVVQLGINVVLVILTGLFGFMPFVPLAVALVVFRNVALWMSMVFLGGVDMFKATLASVPNIFINIFIVSTAGPLLLTIL